MSTQVQSNSNRCYDLFIDPFNQGYYNLRDAFAGKKIEIIGRDALNSPITQERDLSLEERVSIAVIGVLLIIPIVNAVVITILRNINSNYLYTPSQAVGGPSNVTPNVEPLPIVEPISPEAMLERKRTALARLTAIENMVPSGQDALAALMTHFELKADILHFNLDALLQRYQTDCNPSELSEFTDWAGIDWADINWGPFGRGDRTTFRNILTTYDHASSSNPQYYMIKTVVGCIAEYFKQQKALVASGSDAETALKVQFNRVVNSLIDANQNCVDQMLSQVQTLILDLLAEDNTAQQRDSFQRKLINQAGLALCRYRTNLLKEIIERQNRNYCHMADLERIVIQRLASALSMQGGIFAVGAAYANGYVNNIDGRVNAAREAFLQEYKPLEYLLTELRPIWGNNRLLHTNITQWANSYYDLSEEDADGSAPNMDHRISEDFDTLPISQGGALTYPSLALLLEAAGIIDEVSSH